VRERSRIRTLFDPPGHRQKAAGIPGFQQQALGSGQSIPADSKVRVNVDGPLVSDFPPADSSAARTFPSSASLDPPHNSANLWPRPPSRARPPGLFGTEKPRLSISEFECRRPVVPGRNRPPLRRREARWCSVIIPTCNARLGPEVKEIRSARRR